MSRTSNRGSGKSLHKRNQTASKAGAGAGKQKAAIHVSQSNRQTERDLHDFMQPVKVAEANGSNAARPPSDGRSKASGASAASADRNGKSRLNSLLRSSDYDPKRMNGEELGWKKAVHRYVSLYNQSETNQHAGELAEFVQDREHCSRLGARLGRLRERELLRGALPAGCETKAELVRVNESASEVSVLIKLHMKRRMEQTGRFYTEERSEYERLWLGLTGADWDLVRVEPLIAERRPRYGALSNSWLSENEYSEHDEEQPSVSMPYLNYDLLPQFKHQRSAIPYRRDLAAAYADRWWNEGNPAYELFEVNCTNYVSQCIFAGNAPMNYTGKRGSGWWYKGRNKGSEWWSYSWAVSNAMTNFLSSYKSAGLRAELADSADQLQLGDVITYDWNGDGRFQHSTIVTAFDSFGMPLVNANTVASRHRYWDYRDSYAWTEQTKYRFFHIAELL